MTGTVDPVQLFTARAGSYSRFIRLFRYQQGLQGYFMRSPLLRSGIRVLDAGCGNGALLLAFREAVRARGLTPERLCGFDITPAMLDRLRVTLRERQVEDVDLIQADVLSLEALPTNWRFFDLVISASMLEYVPRERFVEVLSGLRSLLNDGGTLLLFITRDNWLMRPMIGRWWQSNLYTARQLEEAFAMAGFSAVAFRCFPPLYRYLALWGHIIEAQC
jgi:cyclopropane fatty-acyl-phospholipid synthase-like methyltransferase